MTHEYYINISNSLNYTVRYYLKKTELNIMLLCLCQIDILFIIDSLLGSKQRSIFVSCLGSSDLIVHVFVNRFACSFAVRVSPELTRPAALTWPGEASRIVPTCAELLWHLKQLVEVPDLVRLPVALLRLKMCFSVC